MVVKTKKKEASRATYDWLNQSMESLPIRIPKRKKMDVSPHKQPTQNMVPPSVQLSESEVGNGHLNVLF